jgi:hypothetical protein
MNATTLLTLALLTAVVCANAADGDKPEKPKPQTFLTVETAGPDYAAQGEYLNDWGGAQVIALGDDRFRLVTFKGGLPGAGWDKEVRNETEGKREGDKIVFNGNDGFKGELADGKITITTASGGPYTMNKTSRTSPTLGAKPPQGALVLFDGKSADEWNNGRVNDRGLLAGGTTTKRKFQNASLHIEFLLPFKPLGRGQDRGNSGVYLQDRYEVQVLDSFGLKGENNECGGIYTKAKPAVNMCFPPLVWQTYDIDFEAAKFDADGKKTKNAVTTVKHNGVVIHDKFEINGPTGGGQPEGPTPGPFQLQDHGNPVFYRNIWAVEK